MHRHTRSEAGDLSSPRSSVAPSFSSERPSISGSMTFQMPSSVRPQPAYIAASVASQIVTDHHNAQLREEFDSDGDDPSAFLINALFSEAALNLLNAFLDHLLFSFLSTARSPSLTAIRPAITDVLKPRLAREAMAAADEELQGLLAGEDDEEFPSQDGMEEKWDIEKVWKRTRLRIMVYTRLGELEDEDEERYVEQERGLSLDEGEDDEAGLVSWASAIFLTSVVEYIAEQTLMVSGQVAFARMAAKLKKSAATSPEGEEPALERIIVEDFDVEKVALNSVLGRLWRTWRKRVRSPITPLSPGRMRTHRSISSLVSSHRRRESHETVDDSVLSELPEHKPTETDIAANIPLPIGDNDVAEIEVPGLAPTFEDEDSGAETPIARPNRPASSLMFSSSELLQKRLARKRPMSMPMPETLPFAVPASQSVTDENDFVTPMERMSEEDQSYIEEQIDEEGEEPTSSVDTDENDPEMVAFAAATGMTVPGLTVSGAKASKNDLEGSATPTQAAYNGKSHVFQSKRMSIEKAGSPEIVRTYSARSARSSLGAQQADEKTEDKAQDRSYLDDAHTDDDVDDKEAIGVAHTSNIPIRATPSPPGDLPANVKGQASSVRKPVERPVQDQKAGHHLAAAPAAVRRTPSPIEKPVPDTPVHRKDATPPRSNSSSRVPALSALQEVESSPPKSQEKHVARRPVNEAQQGSSPNSKRGSSSRSREAPIPVAEYQDMSRPRVESTDGIAGERATLKRVSSTSSTAKSVSTSILHSGRDSESSIGRPRGLSGRMSQEDREREFDTLVKSDDTVKYTLTPQSMRDIDEPPIAKRVDPVGPQTSVTVYPRVNAERENSFGSQPVPTRTASRSRGSSSAKSSGPKPLAREPTIQQESMRDFADFIRSTGPAPGESRPVQPFVKLSAPDTPTKSPPSSGSTISGLGRKLSTRQSGTPTPSSSANEGPSARPRIHMQPRSPAGQRSGNDDLIDFIRQGPPNQQNGQHRIPRTVAPFRTTVDSDQFDRMLDDNGNVESTYGSQVSTASKQSTQNSTSSRTALLQSNNVVQPAYSNTPQNLTGNMSSPEPQITRTRRRIKDPYAIDLSDEEEEDLLTALPSSTRRPNNREESLADFLNSAQPTVSNEPPKPLVTDPAQIAAIKARSRNASNGTGSYPTSGYSPSTSSGPKASPTSPPGRSTKPSPQPAVISSSIRSDAPRSHKPKLQARAAGAKDARTERSATNDLADFLRTSGPPEPAAPAPRSPIKKEEGRRVNARFWRKKTYPDMQ